MTGYLVAFAVLAVLVAVVLGFLLRASRRKNRELEAALEDVQLERDRLLASIQREHKLQEELEAAREKLLTERDAELAALAKAAKPLEDLKVDDDSDAAVQDAVDAINKTHGWG